jgi:hypothetical protein
LNASLLCAGSRGMRFFSEAAVAGHGLGRLDWAESEPTEAALGKSGVRVIAVAPSRARIRPHRPLATSALGVSVRF